MKNIRKKTITLSVIVMFLTMGTIGLISVSAAPSEEMLPIYQPIDLGYKIRSTHHPLINKGTFESTSESYDPLTGTYYELNDILEWPVADWVTYEDTWEPFELRAASSNVEVWVQCNLSYPEGDTRSADVITDEQVNYMMEQFDDIIYPTVTTYFGIPHEHYGDPGGDYYNADGRNVLLISNIRDEMFYDRTYPYYIVGFFSPSYELDLDRNIITIDSMGWDRRTGEGTRQIYEATTAHEYQHLIHDDYNPEDDDFMNEGCSMYSEPLCGYPLSWGDIEAYLATPDNSLTEWADQGDLNILADYGCSLLWAMYLSDHYGDTFLSDFVASTTPGIEGINAVLDLYGKTETFDDVYHDWRLANLLHTDLYGDGKYNYISLDLADTDPTRVYKINRPWFPERLGIDFGTTKSYIKDDTGISMVSSYGSDYIRLGGLKDDFNPIFVFNGDDYATPITWIKEDMDGDNDLEWYSTPALTESDVILETTLDLTSYSTATLSFDTFYNIEELWDYGFVQVSVDGINWVSLANEYTTVLHDPQAYPEIIDNLPGITGVSGDWISMSFDLDDYAGSNIWLRFRYMTDWAFQEPGWWIDNVAINGIVIDNADDISAFALPPPPPTEFMVTIIGVDSAGAYSDDRFTTVNLDGINEFSTPLAPYMTPDGYVLLIISPLIGPADYAFEVQRV
ncbi:MAG: immune inhibitor A [Promethearchaeota archaeon]|nr:MAG: immune inhibitor A [Candidatus Lokiarchaeota archaeon]